ncbi:MAG: hypothetical protein M0C28_46805 [Candidatus Moduliflexus flocculans]|nr:hypothetical protein [Candidatus Moduliflexus flocculans]
MYVALDLFPDAKPAKLVRGGRYGYPEFPTTPTQFEEIGSKVTQLVAKIDKIPIEQIGNDLRDTIQGAKRIANSPELIETVKSLNAAVKELQLLTADLRTRTTPEVNATLRAGAGTRWRRPESAMSADSPLQNRLQATLDELARAAGALRSAGGLPGTQPAEHLDRKGRPANEIDAFIRGKLSSARACWRWCWQDVSAPAGRSIITP